MTAENHNPFVLPGFGQTGEFAQNPVMASMEMMRQAWQSLSGQGGFGPQSVAATMSVEELERRITDLRAVENWLRMNLTVLSNTIQGMEVQRSTIATLKSFVANASAAGAAEPGSSPLEAVLGIRPARAAAPEAAVQPSGPLGDAAEAAAAAFDSEKAVAATQAWWGLLQKQFDTLAAATTATMQGAAAAVQAGADGAAQPEGDAQAGKTSAAAPRKAARRKTPAPAGAKRAAAPRGKPAARKPG